MALTLFSGAAQAENLRRLAPAERQNEALTSLAPAFPGLGEAIVNQRFVDWPGMPLVRASYSFPAPGQVTKFGPVLVDGIVQEGLPPVTGLALMDCHSAGQRAISPYIPGLRRLSIAD